MARKTERFSVSMPKPEVGAIDAFCARIGVSRNEVMRRSTLAYIRCRQTNFKLSVDIAWEEIGQAEDPVTILADGDGVLLPTIVAGDNGQTPDMI